MSQVEPDSTTRLQTRSAAFSLAYQLIGAAFTAILTLYLVRKLGPDDYGIYALATSVGAIVVLLSDAGLAQAAARFIAEHREDHAELHRFVVTTFRLKLVAGGIMSVALLALAGPIAGAYGIPGLETPLRFVALAVFFQSIMFLALAYFEAMSRNEVTLLLSFGESFSETVTSIGLVAAGAGVAGATAGRATGYGVAAFLSMILIFRAVRPPTEPSKRSVASYSRLIAGYAVALLVIDGVMTLFSRVDVLLIGGYLGSDDAGIFEAPMRLTILLMYLGNAVASGYTPRLAGRPGEPVRIEVFQAAMRWLLMCQCFAAVVILVWATPIANLALGTGYGESAAVLRALSPYVFLAGLASVVTLAVNYLGEARRRIPLALGALALNVVIDIILIPRIGPIAGAIGTGAAFALYVPGHFLVLRRRIGLPLRPLAATTCRSFAAAGFAALPLLAIGTGKLSFVAVCGGLVAGVALFAVGLVLTREVSTDEIRQGIAVVRRMGFR